MFDATLKNPTPEDVKIFRNPATRRHMEQVIHALREMAEAVTPSGIAAIARVRWPDEELPNALTRFENGIRSDIAALKEYQNRHRLMEEAANMHLAPLVKASARRLFEAQDERDLLDRKIANAERDYAAQHARLKEAGLSDGEIEKLAKRTDVAGLSEESSRLAVEVKTLDDFLRTKDESLLSDEFLESAKAYESPPRAGTAFQESGRT